MKRSLVALALLVVSVAAVRTARADEDPDPNPSTEHPGLDLGIRTGYSIPFGKMTGADGDDVSQGISGAVPLVVEAMFRANPQFSVGLLFQYAFAQTKSGGATGCGTNGVDCSSSDIHLAIQGMFHPTVSGSFAPWLGLGTGYEWFGIDASSGGTSASAGISGFEFLILQAGGDIQVAPQFSLGPFVMFSLGEYGSQTLSAPGVSQSMDITNTAVHEWLSFGVRGTFSL
jgi:outer membrane protein W